MAGKAVIPPLSDLSEFQTDLRSRQGLHSSAQSGENIPSSLASLSCGRLASRTKAFNCIEHGLDSFQVGNYFMLTYTISPSAFKGESVPHFLD